ncbi:fibroblast growth factor 19-like [Salminus brasiliensis]|uniref:fibroblast growth factor 19-like n=1 Tax=Salminus brasiliensis TaxID=930266 RepID=UPI003B8323B9
MFLVVVVSLLLRLSLSLPLSVHDSSPLLAFDDQVRQRHLYAENKHRSLFLAISPNGTITGSPSQTENTKLELRAVKPGQIVIWGVTSSHYLCVNASGQVIALSVFLESDCSFNELLQPDGYTHFISAHHRLPMSLTFVPHTPPYTQFLLLRSTLLIETQPQEHPEGFKAEVDLDSDDPFSLRQAAQYPRSPIFYMD